MGQSSARLHVALYKFSTLLDTVKPFKRTGSQAKMIL
jgi:hypothetical protein